MYACPSYPFPMAWLFMALPPPPPVSPHTLPSLRHPSGDPTTFDSQSTFVLPYTRADGSTLYIYCGDRWNAAGPGGLLNSTYIWLPLLPTSGGQWNMSWHDSWRIGDF